MIDPISPTGVLGAPAAPFRGLPVHENLESRRRAMLQLTTPFSLTGSPALVVPWQSAVIQIVAPRGRDADLADCSRELAPWFEPSPTGTVYFVLKSNDEAG